MDFAEMFFVLLELLGTASFSIAGAMAGVRKKADIFGVLLLGTTTAVGGGIIRDLLLGRTPPAAFRDGKMILLALISAGALFLLVRRHQDWYLRSSEEVDAINNVFDALGLGLFTVVGVQTAVSAGQGENLLFCVFLGMTTGVGGGLLRDIMLGEIPGIITKRVYAVASILGALCYWALYHLPAVTIPSATLCSILLIFLIRMAATKNHWNLPKAID